MIVGIFDNDVPSNECSPYISLQSRQNFVSFGRSQACANIQALADELSTFLSLRRGAPELEPVGVADVMH